VRVADEDLAVTVSIGIAVSAGDPASVDSLLRRADAAMYLAKGDGRNRVATAAAP
jgi:two-component system cell cycle response regulator